MRTLGLIASRIVLALAALLITAQPVLAQSAEDYLDFNQNDINYYRPEPLNTGCGEDTAPFLQGTGNIQIAYNFLIDKGGISALQASAVLGNLRRESGVDPTAQQDKSNDPFPKDGVGFGIVQWTFDSRQKPLVKQAAAAHKPVIDLGVQLNYMWYEFKNAFAGFYSDLLKEKNLDSATALVNHKYEVSGDPHPELRLQFAQEVFAAATAPDAASRGWHQAKTGAKDGEGVCENSGKGIVNAEGYAFPLAPQKQRDYTTLPCPPSKANYQGNYTNRYGITDRIVSCHGPYPAFDLYYNGYGAAGKVIYAITDGTIRNLDKQYVNRASRGTGAKGRPCHSFQLQSTKERGGYYYWYGHIIAGVKANQKVEAGDPIGITAPTSYGPLCWGGAPHLHIDRGCVDRSGTPHEGGMQDCREPTFMHDLKVIWDSLPK